MFIAPVSLLRPPAPWPCTCARTRRKSRPLFSTRTSNGAGSTKSWPWTCSLVPRMLPIHFAKMRIHNIFIYVHTHRDIDEYGYLCKYLFLFVYLCVFVSLCFLERSLFKMDKCQRCIYENGKYLQKHLHVNINMWKHAKYACMFKNIHMYIRI